MRASKASKFQYWVPLTRPQMEALYNLYKRQASHNTYLSFRRTAQYSKLNGWVMVRWCGMWVGIESEGYTHT